MTNKEVLKRIAKAIKNKDKLPKIPRKNKWNAVLKRR